MAKICKSCGAEYKGDFCDKCGYGNPDIEINAQKKVTKKYKSNKPERFMTPEELAEKRINHKIKDNYKDAIALKKKNNLIILIIMAVIVLGLVGFVLYRNGVFTDSEEKKFDVITNYFSAIAESDYDKYTDTMTKEMAKSIDEARDKNNLDKEDFLKESYADYTKLYGENYTAAVNFGQSSEITGDDISKSEDDYENNFGKKIHIQKAYEITTMVKFAGSKKTETLAFNVDVAKISGKWRILNIDEQDGYNESDGVASSESK